MGHNMALGRFGEDLAVRHLRERGLVILDRNWRCDVGEIDIVAREADVLVVCEVKTRRTTGFGSPLEAITASQGAAPAAARRLLAARTPATAGRGSGRSRGRRGHRTRCLNRVRAVGPLMSLATAHTVTLMGVTGTVVHVEVDATEGVPGVRVVGLADTAVSEARDRVRSAILNVGEQWRSRKVTINLSPASVRKRGSGFDLALACACLGAFDSLTTDQLADWLFIGELGLDGAVRPVRGILPMVLAAAEAGHQRVMVAAGSATEAALVPEVQVTPVGTLREALGVLRGTEPGCTAATLRGEPQPWSGPDLGDVHGQSQARFALEVAAAGGHHLFLHGAPGSGKTLLAERLPGLLPTLDARRALEVSAVHSVAGVLDATQPLIVQPPFQAPHHTASAASHDRRW